MHNAFEVSTILERLPLQIETISAYDENLVVGTKQGHLLMYSISTDASNMVKINLLRSNKNFSRKPIVQVAVIPEHQILISLSDQIISVHDLTVFNFPLLTLLTKTKGAVAFDLDVKRHQTLTGQIIVTVRLVVAVRRKLQLYYWKARQFQELKEELVLPDSPKSVAWSGEAVAVGFKQEYWIVKLTGEQKELFATGKTQEPLIMKIPDGTLAVARDEKIYFVNNEGKPTCNYSLELPEQPIAMAFDDPYVVAVLPKCVNVQSQEPRLDIQKLDLEKPKFITSTTNSKNQTHVFVASISHIWCLCPIPVGQQIKQLLDNKQFELALKIAELWNESEHSKNQMKQHIQKLYALHLFCEFKFKDAIIIFQKLNTDILFVIGLFHDLVPKDYRERLQYPHPIPALEGEKLKEAMQELIHFLLQMRSKFMADQENIHDSPAIKAKNQKLQIIDTTLLKCYLQTNDSLVTPFLRKRDSRVSIEEAERVLRKAVKYKEFVLLLQTRGMHSRALQLLLRHSKRLDSPIHEHSHTVNYLQQLGPEYIDLIFEFSDWVLIRFPEDGLKIFTGEGSSDTSDMELLPRGRVLEFIRKTNKDLMIQYLEHIIWEWGDSTPDLHNKLIQIYKEKILRYPRPNEDSTLAQQVERNKLRVDLQKILKMSSCYEPERVIVHFPPDYENDLSEEKAIIFGRLGQHEKALKLYINVLDDVNMAIEYCHSQYSSKGASMVYIILIKHLIGCSGSPCSSAANSPVAESPFTSSKINKRDRTKDKELVLEILRNYSQCIDTEQALKYLPNDMSVMLLKSYIHKSLIHLSTINKENKLLKGLTNSIGTQAKHELSLHQMKKIELTDQTICSVCFKRFTSSCAFAWSSSGHIFHFSCKDLRSKS